MREEASSPYRPIAGGQAPTGSFVVPDSWGHVDGQTATDSPADGRPWIALGACAVFLLGAVLPLLYLSSHAARDGDRPSAELSFINPSSIESWTGRGSLTFRFLIRNLAQHRHAYRYDIAVSCRGTKARPRGSEVADLDPGESRIVSWTETSPPPGRFKVSVSVPGTGNHIHFSTRAPAAGENAGAGTDHSGETQGAC